MPTNEEIRGMIERLNGAWTSSAMPEAAAMLSALLAEREWRPIAEAPRDGTEIEGFDEIGQSCGVVMWSNRPVCMLGPINGGHKPGWATGFSSDTDANLPVEAPVRWRPLPPHQRMNDV
jgi:hypothetical protein